MKYLFTLLLFIPLFGFTQNNLAKQLDSITTKKDADTFLKTHKPEDGKIYIYNKEKHKTKIATSLFKLSEGGKKVIKNDFKKTYYKVIDKSKVDHCKFNIIVLDGEMTSNQSAKVIRNKVLSQYNEGYKFEDLAKQHSSGPTAKTGGDTGWIKLGDISDTFDEQAFNQNRAIDEVFTVDDSKNKKYYIVVKTKDKTPIEEITVLKFTEDL
ncbi:peptidylprolyl isomerase [uncultured Winogradskyella sp.]|uniref:peptidylprolyl isomerase n=1 Tax=uncultured Winogradskyella sp. TaxID=395353 RepID=UPI00260B33AB|nr:peptidylprolyl isomerase [uncultured Winogradskyella sp.]